MRDSGFIEFIPYTLIASVIFAIWGAAAYRLGTVNDSRRDRPPQECALNRQRWILHTVSMVGGLWLAEWCILSSRQGSVYRALAMMMSMLLPGWYLMILNWWFERRIMRAVPYPLPDPLRQEEEASRINRRIEEIAGQLGGQPEVIAISSDFRATRYADVSHGRDDKLHVSRLLLDVMSPHELDYLLAREFVPLRGLDRVGHYSVLIPIGTFAIVLVVWMLLGDPFAALKAGSLLAALSIPAAVWLGRRSECAKDLLALSVVGDQTIAESAIVKSMKHGLTMIAIGDPGKDQRVQRRLTALRSGLDQCTSST